MNNLIIGVTARIHSDEKNTYVRIHNLRKLNFH